MRAAKRPSAWTSRTCGITTLSSASSASAALGATSSTAPSSPSKAAVPRSLMGRQNSKPPRRHEPSWTIKTDGAQILLWRIWHVVWRKSSALTTLSRPSSASCGSRVAGVASANETSTRSVTMTSVFALGPSMVAPWYLSSAGCLSVRARSTDCCIRGSHTVRCSSLAAVNVNTLSFSLVVYCTASRRSQPLHRLPEIGRGAGPICSVLLILVKKNHAVC